VKVRDALKRRAYSRHALLRTWDVEVRRDIRRQLRELMDRQDAWIDRQRALSSDVSR
jgi:hypothetical protein